LKNFRAGRRGGFQKKVFFTFYGLQQGGNMNSFHGRGREESAGPPAQLPLELYHKKAQADRLLEFFRAHRGEWIPLDRILSFKIAQYNTRISDLRKAGHVIENKTEWKGRSKHSWFRYTGERAA
jgi:hypothetical protein